MSPAEDVLAARLAALTIADRHRLGRRLARAVRGGDERARTELARLEATIEAAARRREARQAALPKVSYPDDLPISARREDIAGALRDHQVVVVAGETGSGKTTQLPKICLELGRGVDGMIGHTQPRRIAARTVAERLAEELGVPLGGAVGYAVRFGGTVGETTLVKVMTDGVLLAEIRRDRGLRAYDTIIVDEAHERSLNIDFLLGYLTQLLPRRPDLKVVVTSATIDTARFAAHFGAPVVEVSGRTHPVEVRYRPLGAPGEGPAARHGPGGGRGWEAGEWERGAQDPSQGIVDAVGELVGEGPGDVLVFLPGERDIRDAAEALRGAELEGVEVLPLYARLSAAEQHRVFRPHRGRRVVLATNVAETSITVPGIRYVVDTGLARISRYSHRTKVQRLPIEPVSRASADQRAGRCGRVGPGVCIRLYADDDYGSRPEFTDPEIVRTNLASVILQMAAIGLGEVEAFPFVEPPDRRAVADGRALLEELGAFVRREGRWCLTPLGRRLAELPLDPRLGRMVLEAERRGCVREVTVIAAALSIQDPRERPADAAAEADELHGRFVVPDSDFLGLVRLFDYVAELQAQLSGNQLRKRLRTEHLNVLRLREWQDVVGQIRQVLRAEGIHASRDPARSEDIHQAVLAGLLSQVGMRDRVGGDYLGARASRWQIARSSALARHQPPWVMAGTLVETGRTFASAVARIEPVWAERVGAHVVKRTFATPFWDPEKAEAMIEERVTLYGLPIVDRRASRLARLDPGRARALVIQHGLIEGDWSLELPFRSVTLARMEEVRALEERVRRRGLLAGEGALFAFYDARLPPEVTSGERLLRWFRREAGGDPEVLAVPFEVLLDATAGGVDRSGYPDRWVQDDLELPLRYRFEPGADDDGVTVEVPLLALSGLSSDWFEWNVPGHRVELVSALVRSLPKAVRRSFVPAAEVAREVVATTGPGDGPLLEVVADRLAHLRDEAVSADWFDVAALPGWLRMRFEVVDGLGRVVAAGRDVARLASELRGAIRSALAAAAPGVERHGVTRWDFGDLPRQVRCGPAVGYPALVDEGHAVGVVVVESERAQAESMWRGTRRLLLLAAPVEVDRVQRRLTEPTRLVLASSSTPFEAILAECASAVADALLAGAGGPSFEAAGFARMAGAFRAELPGRVARLATTAASVLSSARSVATRAALLGERDRDGGLAAALGDVRRQVRGLVGSGWIAAAGEERLGDLPRYLEALSRRLGRLPGDLRRDAERQSVVERVEASYRLLDERLSAPVGPGSQDAEAIGGALAEVRWMIEELRVSLWAQDLGTKVPVSEARIRRAIERRMTLGVASS